MKKKTWTPKPTLGAAHWKKLEPQHFCAAEGCTFRLVSVYGTKRECPRHPLAEERARMTEASRPLAAALIEETPEETDARLAHSPDTCRCSDGMGGPCVDCRAVFDAQRPPRVDLNRMSFGAIKAHLNATLDAAGIAHRAPTEFETKFYRTSGGGIE